MAFNLRNWSFITLKVTLGFFVFNTNLTLLYNIDTKGFKKKEVVKVSPGGSLPGGEASLPGGKGE